MSEDQFKPNDRFREDYPLKPTESDLERESLDAQEPEFVLNTTIPPSVFKADLQRLADDAGRLAGLVADLEAERARLAADNRRMHLLYEIVPPEKNAVELMDQAGRALLLFAKHASAVDPEHGFATIESPEPWRAAGAFFDAAYGGTFKAKEALGYA